MQTMLTAISLSVTKASERTPSYISIGRQYVGWKVNFTHNQKNQNFLSL